MAARMAARRGRLNVWLFAGSLSVDRRDPFASAERVIFCTTIIGMNLIH